MTTTEYTVTGMTCGHCASAVRGEVEQIPGVDTADVSLTDGTLVVTSAAELDDAVVLAAVEEAGYQGARS